MKLLLAFMFICLTLGTIWEHKSARRYLLPVVGLSLLVMAGYYFFNQT